MIELETKQFFKIKKLKVFAHNSLSTPNPAWFVLSKRILRALCSPRKAEERVQGLALSPSCQRLDPHMEPLPACPHQGRTWIKSLRRTKTTFSPVKQRALLGKQWPCCGSKELGLCWGQKLSPSLIRLTTCSSLLLQRSPESPPHLPSLTSQLLSPPPHSRAPGMQANCSSPSEPHSLTC